MSRSLVSRAISATSSPTRVSPTKRRIRFTSTGRFAAPEPPAQTRRFFSPR